MGKTENTMMSSLKRDGRLQLRPKLIVSLEPPKIKTRHLLILNKTIITQKMGANVDWGECGLGRCGGESRIVAVSPICVGRVWKGAVRPSDSGANPVLGL